MTAPEARGAGFGRLRPAVLGIALFAGAAILGVFLLRLLMRTGETGGRTLGALSPLVSGLIAVGEALTLFAGSHQALVRGAGFFLGASGVLFVMGSVRIANLKPAVVGTALLLLGAMLLFPESPAASAVLGILAGLALAWRTGNAPYDGDTLPARFLVLVPLGAGALLRFWALGEVPAGFSSHAVFHQFVNGFPYFEAVARRYAARGVLALPGVLVDTCRDGHFAEDSLVPAVGYALLGINFTAARLMSALLGTVTVYVAYRAGAALSGRRLGLLFALLLALSPWHVQISRYGDAEHVLSPLQFLLALWLLEEALERGRLLHYLSAALALGLGWFVYSPNQAGLLLLGLLALLRLSRTPSVLRRDGWKAGLATAVLILLSVAPLGSLAEGGRIAPNFRTGYGWEEVSLTDIPRIRTMLRMAGQQLFLRVDDPWFGKPGGGLGAPEAALLFPGLVLSFRWLFLKRRRDLAVLVLSGIPMTLLPGILAPDGSFRRFFLTATLILLLGAAVLDAWSDSARAAGISPRALLGLGTAGGALLLCLCTFTYFRRVYVETEETCRFAFEMTRAARASLGREFVVAVVRHLGPETDPYLRYGAHDELTQAGAAGRSPDQLYSLQTCTAFAPRLDALPRIGGRCRILVEQDLLWNLTQSCGGFDLVQELAKRFPAAVRTEVRSARGDVVLTSWSIE